MNIGLSNNIGFLILLISTLVILLIYLIVNIRGITQYNEDTSSVPLDTLRDFLDEYPEGTHILVFNEEGDQLLNAQKGWIDYDMEMRYLNNAYVLDHSEFKSNLYSLGIRVKGVKVVVGSHES